MARTRKPLSCECGTEMIAENSQTFGSEFEREIVAYAPRGAAVFIG